MAELEPPSVYAITRTMTQDCEAEVDEGLCDWSGPVDVDLQFESFWWTCPRCGYEHEGSRSE